MKKKNRQIADQYFRQSLKLDEQIKEMIAKDTYHVNPNAMEMTYCPHTALNENQDKTKAFHDVDDIAGSASRYYEDKNFARAYVLDYTREGIAIICNKQTKSYSIFILGEDDGAWFVTENFPHFTYCKHKSDFIYLVSEVLNIFNDNFKDI